MLKDSSFNNLAPRVLSQEGRAPWEWGWSFSRRSPLSHENISTSVENVGFLNRKFASYILFSSTTLRIKPSLIVKLFEPKSIYDTVCYTLDMNLYTFYNLTIVFSKWFHRDIEHFGLFSLFLTSYPEPLWNYVLWIV